MKISKSDYVLGIKCPNALWFKKFRKDIEPEMNEAVLRRGTEIGELAQTVFPGGTCVTAKPWQDDAITQTQDAIAQNAPFVFEATLATTTGEYCAVDILRNNNDGTWDIIEVKSVNNPHDYHYLDVSFQRYVCRRAGLDIRNSYIMTLNGDYVRHGALDVSQLFKLTLATDQELQPDDVVAAEIERIRAILSGPELGVAISKVKCGRFYECGYKHHCWANVPQYSVFNAFRASDADEIYQAYGADLHQIPRDLYNMQMHDGDIEAFLSGCENVNPAELVNFLGRLKYPLYFLDYESIQPAVPMFDNSRPYQQICFQYSLHVKRAPDAPLEHYEYLHDTESDPRPDLIRHLIADCGDTGSVIVYHQVFEKGRNTEMARDFPEYVAALESINARMVDLLTPFKYRDLYRPCQCGSASIKKTLPAFVPEMTYDNLGIRNGTQASDKFLEFMQGTQSPSDTAQMMQDLRQYCGQDTLAMVRLLDVVAAFAK